MSDSNEEHAVDGRIERAKNELEEMIDLNPQIILLVDKQGRIVRANKATLEFLGITEFAEILSKDVQSILRIQDTEALSALLTNPRGYRKIRSEANLPRLGLRHLELSLVTSGRERELSVLIVSDVSDESEKAQNLERRHKKEALEALTGALMHNINQPLTVIMMRAQMMKFAIQRGQPDSADIRRGLDDVMKLAMTVADMLQTVDKPRDFVTEPYVQGVEILDMQKSGAAAVELDLSCSAMLNVLLMALESRMPGSVDHARRCGVLSYAVAELAGLDARTCDITREAGYLHDIGKLAMPDGIVLKPASLSVQEQDIMRTHVETGYQIVRSLIFLQDEADAVRAHHENWDGSGYPQGLAGEDIPVAARITACSDAFEVMLSGRPYRQPLSLEETIKEFRKHSGRQFDPAISDIVIEHSKKLHGLIQ